MFAASSSHILKHRKQYLKQCVNIKCNYTKKKQKKNYANLKKAIHFCTMNLLQFV